MEDNGEVVNEESILNYYSVDCHHHLRNVWIKGMDLKMTKFLTNILAEDLSEIHFRYRVSTSIVPVMISVDKEFSLPANYPKGHGHEFKFWLNKYHPGVLLVAVERVTGQRHDLAVEGTAAIYWNRKYYIEFLNDRLIATDKGKGNILQTNLFVVLSCMELVAMCRVYAIFHFCISIPMRWLAGNCHLLKHCNFSVRSMGRTIDILEEAMSNIVTDGSRMLSEFFMCNIWDELLLEIPEFQSYMNYLFEEKQQPTINKHQSNLPDFITSKVLPFDLLKAELFYPNRDENKVTDNLCTTMAVVMGKAILVELRDTTKATHEHLSSGKGEKGGRWSWGNTTDEQHKAGLGKMATNDTAESPFAGLTNQLGNFGTILGIHAGGISQARINGDFKRKNVNGNKKDGMYHMLPTKMKQSLLTMAIKEAPNVRRKEAIAIEKQQQHKQQKQDLLKRIKLIKAETLYINCLAYIEKFILRQGGRQKQGWHWKSFQN